MGGKRKRKVDHEGQIFNKDWGVKYFFVQAGDKALCVICNDTVAVLKEYNLRRHYGTKHQLSYSQYTGSQRSKQALTRASYKAAYVLAKRGKSFTDGCLIKESMMEVVEELCPEKANLFKTKYCCLKN